MGKCQSRNWQKVQSPNLISYVFSAYNPLPLETKIITSVASTCCGEWKYYFYVLNDINIKFVVFHIMHDWYYLDSMIFTFQHRFCLHVQMFFLHLQMFRKTVFRSDYERLVHYHESKTEWRIIRPIISVNGSICMSVYIWSVFNLFYGEANHKLISTMLQMLNCVFV